MTKVMGAKCGLGPRKNLRLPVSKVSVDGVPLNLHSRLDFLRSAWFWLKTKSIETVGGISGVVSKVSKEGLPAHLPSRLDFLRSVWFWRKTKSI